MLPLAAWVYTAFLGLFITLFILVSVLLILIVLIQKGRGGGLASAFGGGGGGNTAFGSKTGDVLTWATSIIFGVFLLIAVILNLMTRPTNHPAVAEGTTPAQQQQQQQQQQKQSAPADRTAPPAEPTRGLTTIPPIDATATNPGPATKPSK